MPELQEFPNAVESGCMHPNSGQAGQGSVEDQVGFVWFAIDTMPTFDEFQERVRTFQSDGMALLRPRVFRVTVFPMLHMLARIDAHIPVYYVDTGYLFPETPDSVTS